MGTTNSFYYQNVCPGNTSVSCSEMKHLLFDFTVCLQHWKQGVVFPQQPQRPWAPFATWGDKTALHSPHSGGDSWGVPVYGTEQEQGCFMLFPWSNMPVWMSIFAISSVWLLLCSPVTTLPKVVGLAMVKLCCYRLGGSISLLCRWGPLSFTLLTPSHGEEGVAECLAVIS